MSMAFQQSLIAIIPNLRAFANSLCGNASMADDLVQETLVKAWNNAASFREGTNMRAWLFTILRNTYFSELRKRHREVEDVDGAFAEGVSVLPPQNSHMELLDFRRVFDQLTDDQKEVLILVGAEGFSYEQASEICGCAVGTVKSRVNRARTALSQRLGAGAAVPRGEISSPEPIRLPDPIRSRERAGAVRTQKKKING